MRKLALVLGLMSTLAMGAELYNNGPLSTGAVSSNGVNAPAGTTWSECQPPGTIAGYGWQQTAGNRVADDFTVPAGGWTIQGIDLFGYQTGATSNTYTSVRMQIWNGVPEAAGSAVVWGNTTTNILGTGSFANMYRIFTAQPGTTRQIMKLPLNVSVNLPAGTYWLDTTATGSLASGPWMPQVTITGQPGKPGANGRQRTSTGWAAVLDGGVGQDFPFIITGVPEPAALALLALGLVIRRR